MTQNLNPVLNPTPSGKLIDHRRHPYFLWDVEIDVEAFTELLHHHEPEVRAYWLAKLMRQAKPDDVFIFTKLQDIRALWPLLQPYLGEKRAFWLWLLEKWRT